MISLSAGANEAVAEAYDFGSHSHVVDVGGGHGQLLSAILARHPNLNGTLFDREAGIASATSRPGDAVTRTRLIAGDFFDSVPAGADVYVLKKVIHDWDDERAAKILETADVRTEEEYGELLARARLRLDQVLPTKASISVLESSPV